MGSRVTHFQHEHEVLVDGQREGVRVNIGAATAYTHSPWPISTAPRLRAPPRSERIPKWTGSTRLQTS